MKILLTGFSILALVAMPVFSVTSFAGDAKGASEDAQSGSKAASPTGDKAEKNDGTGSASPSTTDRPASKDDCMNGGWSKYNFKNQGECISSLNRQGGSQSSSGSGAAAGSASPSTTDSKSSATPGSGSATGGTTSGGGSATTGSSGTTSGSVSGSTGSGSTAGSASPSIADTPSSRDDCRNGGWSKYSTPKFKNQGDCISWVNKHQRSSRTK